MEANFLQICQRLTQRPLTEFSTLDEAQLSTTFWSSYQSSRVSQTPLCNLFLIGTHDSGAYELSTKTGFAIDRPELQSNLFLRLFYLIGSQVIHRFSITQKFNVYEQLLLGARYLDIRVGLRPEDKHFYIVHNLYGPRLEIILDQVVRFIAQNEREIVVLDFQHLHGFQSDEDHARLMRLVTKAIRRDKIIPPTMVANASELTLERIWSTRRQVIIIYRNTFQSRDQCVDIYCNSSLLPNPWPNTCDPKKLSSYLEERLEAREQQQQQPMKMFVTQAVLTPHVRFVFLNAFSSLRKSVVKKSNAIILELLKQRYGQGEERSSSSSPASRQPSNERAFGANIVMIDFLEAKQNELIKYCHKLNEQYYA